MDLIHFHIDIFFTLEYVFHFWRFPRIQSNGICVFLLYSVVFTGVGCVFQWFFRIVLRLKVLLRVLHVAISPPPCFRSSMFRSLVVLAIFLNSECRISRSSLVVCGGVRVVMSSIGLQFPLLMNDRYSCIYCISLRCIWSWFSCWIIFPILHHLFASILSPSPESCALFR